MDMQQMPAGKAENSQKEWYKKWWGVIIILLIWPLFAIWYIWEKTHWERPKKGLAILGVIIFATLIYGDKNSTQPTKQPSSEATETKQETTSQETKPAEPTKPQFIFDVPSLIGKNLDEVKSALGKPTNEKAPTKQQATAINTWEVEYEKDGVGLLVSYNLKTKNVIEFFMDGDDKNKLLSQGNLQEKNDAYIVEPVKNIIDQNKITGIKIAKKLPQELNADVTYNAIAFKIDNKEDYNWGNCRFEINGKLFGSGYEYKSASGIKANDSLIVPFSEFTHDGKRFNFFSEKPEKLFISCDTLSQHRSNFFSIN